MSVDRYETTVDDYINDLTSRDGLEIVLSECPEPLWAKLSLSIEKADNQFLAQTLEDVEHTLRRKHWIDLLSGWWWHRRPIAGPLANDLASPSRTQLKLYSLLPKSKIDTEAAEALVELGFPAVAPILPELLEWLQDINWPVAQVLAPFLARIGAPLKPYIKKILETDDGTWKYWVLINIVAESRELQDLLAVELDHIAHAPKSDEKLEEVDDIAREILAKRKTDL